MFLQKILADIVPIKTSHNIGEKRVLFSRLEADTPITQIAITRLNVGDHVENHSHPTMDEHFIIINGKCKIIVDRIEYICDSRSYIYVPSMKEHAVEVLENVELLTIGVALS